jgi:phosphoribosyl-ATP pyrophosphohydrolase/phosphoribosyl-AMP cyclohydrolase
MIIEQQEDLDGLDFGKGGGLLPLIAQNALTGEVLMLGYADREALSRTLSQQVVWFYSRSRKCLWRKGETSGNTLRLVSLHADCDRDAMVALVEPSGPTCHTGESTCFSAAPTLVSLATVLATRFEDHCADAANTERSYTVQLYSDANLRYKKLAEEALELALACATDERSAVAEEAADLLYHLLVASRAAGVPLESILQVLAYRRTPSARGRD